MTFPPISKRRQRHLLAVLDVLKAWDNDDDIEVADPQLAQDASWLDLIRLAPATMTALMQGGFRLRPPEPPQSAPKATARTSVPQPVPTSPRSVSEPPAPAPAYVHPYIPLPNQVPYPYVPPVSKEVKIKRDNTQCHCGIMFDPGSCKLKGHQ